MEDAAGSRGVFAPVALDLRDERVADLRRLQHGRRDARG